MPKFGASVIGIGPYGETGRFPQPPGPAAHSGASAPADGRDEKKSEQRSSPKGSSTSGNPSVTAAPCQLPLHKGALGTGDADCRVGPAGLLAMTMVFCHSGERSDVGIRPFYDERGFGPMYLGHGLRRPNFVPKFGASVRSSAPTESPINRPSLAPAAARDGRESAQEPSQGPPPRPLRQRLAKRKARKEQLVKFSLCPMTSLFSTAYWVRKSNESPARVPAEAASIEQDSLAPHPAARQGASRP